MNVKSQPNRAEYLEVLRRMTPQERLQKAFELSEMAKQLFRDGLRRRFPDLSEEELKRIYMERLARCHNRNY